MASPKSHAVRRYAVLALAWLAACGTAVAAPLPEVDLALILAVDVSPSIDANENRIQREGYVTAFRHPDIAAAISSGAIGKIAVMYFEWAGPRHQSVAVPWTIIASPTDAADFADALAAQPVIPEAGTSISASLAFARRLFAVSGVSALRRAIDISGDGRNNDGPPLAPVRDLLVADGVTVNGLPIESRGNSGLAAYYAQNVIGGPGAFVVAVTEEESLAEAIRRKLTLEIADIGGSDRGPHRLALFLTGGRP